MYFGYILNLVCLRIDTCKFTATGKVCKFYNRHIIATVCLESILTLGFNSNGHFYAFRMLNP